MSSEIKRCVTAPEYWCVGSDAEEKCEAYGCLHARGPIERVLSALFWDGVSMIRRRPRR